MPGKSFAGFTLPDWADPKQASVFDYPGQGLLRKAVGLLGLDDPATMVNMALGTAEIPVGKMGGGAIEAVAAKLPRFAKAIRAFHGSPHDFTPEPGAPLGTFKSAAIGTGEGAQAYGHGLYFAEREGTARAYRDALADEASVLVDGATRRLNTESAADMAMMHLSQGRENPIAIRRGFTEPFANEYEATLAKYRGRVQAAKPGKMYEVDIKSDPEHFLDWDKPIYEQTPHVQEALKKAGIHEGNVFPPAGERAYQKAYDLAGTHSQADASARLQAAGIPGIKYLDRQSRGLASGGGSRNFVIFDDKTIDILKKYGVMLGAAGAGTGALTQTPRPPAQNTIPVDAGSPF